MKWIVLFVLIAVTPILASTFRANKRYLVWGGFTVGLLPFLIDPFHLSVSPIAWPDWPGAVKGIEITMLDAVAIAVVLASRRHAPTPIAIKAALAVYLTGFCVSSVLAPIKWPEMFYGWQVIRTALVYFAVARGCASDPRFAPAAISGALTGLVVQAGVAASQFVGGTVQAGGLFGHQNLLGMATHFAVYSAFALLLAGFLNKRAALGLLCGLLVAYSGGSRATIGLMAACLILTAILSLWHRITSRKMAIGGMVIAGILAASPILYTAVERRSAAAREESNLERERMAEAARMIISDYPLGVGAGRYVIVTNTEGYSARTGVAWNYYNRRAAVHNTYYVVAAEMGWIGLFGLISMLIAAIYTGMNTLRKNRNDGIESTLLVGLIISVIAASLHMLFEWITMLSAIHYLIGITFGLIVGIRTQLQIKAGIEQPGAHERKTLLASTPSPELVSHKGQMLGDSSRR